MEIQGPFRRPQPPPPPPCTFLLLIFDSKVHVHSSHHRGYTLQTVHNKGRQFCQSLITMLTRNRGTVMKEYCGMGPHVYSSMYYFQRRSSRKTLQSLYFQLCRRLKKDSFHRINTCFFVYKYDHEIVNSPPSSPKDVDFI